MESTQPPLRAVIRFFALIAFAVAAWGQAFRHPGVVYSQQQLDYVRDKVKLGLPPWKAAYDDMRGSEYGPTGYTPHPREAVDCGTKSNPNLGCSDEQGNSIAAVTQALLWQLNGNEAHAKAAVRILNAWAGTVKTHGLYNARLESGWTGTHWAKAGEIMRATYPAWTAAEVQKFSAMLRNAYLPYLVNGAPEQNGNWELTIVEAMMNIAVFLDDRSLFDKAVDMWRKRMPAYLYLTSDGPLPVPPPNWRYERIYELLPPPAPMKTHKDTIINYWYNQETLVDGLCQETCRDFAHSGYGIASLTYAAETAWLQGVDLYGEMAARMTAAMEFQSKYWVNQPVPKWLCGGTLNLRTVPIFEVGYNHYHNRRQIDLPFTKQWIQKSRPMGADHHMIWETIAFAELGAVGGEGVGVAPEKGASRPRRLGMQRQRDGSLRLAVSAPGAGGTIWYDLEGRRLP